MKKLAIIGASHFQNPLILKAREKGIETHVFAWQCGDIGETTADYFYPISITEKELILDECRKIGVDGVLTIASDLANITASYVANKLGLTANGVDCVQKSTNKHLMRLAFEEGGDPSPRSVLLAPGDDIGCLDLDYPVIVKPADRSGSRGVSKVGNADALTKAISRAYGESFSEEVLVEEYVEGREFSVECISWQGKHAFLAITEKFTTGAPGFIETGHLEPARVSGEVLHNVQAIVFHALDTLGIKYGASHSEVKIDEGGVIKIIEIGSRMGGDYIGSDLVRLSTGYDYLSAVIDVALGVEPDEASDLSLGKQAAVRFVFDQEDLAVLDELKRNSPEILCYESSIKELNHEVVDSSTRFGCYIFSADSLADVAPYLPAC